MSIQELQGSLISSTVNSFDINTEAIGGSPVLSVSVHDLLTDSIPEVGQTTDIFSIDSYHNVLSTNVIPTQYNKVYQNASTLYHFSERIDITADQFTDLFDTESSLIKSDVPYADQSQNLNVFLPYHDHFVDDILFTSVNEITTSNSVMTQESVEIIVSSIQKMYSIIGKSLNEYEIDSEAIDQYTEFISYLDNAYHDHFVDEIESIQNAIALIENTVHNHTVDELIIYCDHNIYSEDSIHNHTVEIINDLIQDHFISSNNSIHNNFSKKVFIEVFNEGAILIKLFLK